MKQTALVMMLVSLTGCASGPECSIDNTENCTVNELYRMTDELNRDTLKQLERAEETLRSMR